MYKKKLYTELEIFTEEFIHYLQNIFRGGGWHLFCTLWMAAMK